jgi:hypothetical protein
VVVYTSQDKKTTQLVILDNGGYNTVAESPIQKPMCSIWKNVSVIWVPLSAPIAMHVSQ